MSYKRKTTEEPLNSYFSDLSNFVNIAPHLIQSNNSETFKIWLDKLAYIDKRALYLYLKKHKEQIKPKHIAIAQEMFLKEI